MIENRKEDHIRIAESKEVNASHNFWDDITLIHRAIPEVDYEAINTETEFYGNRLKYPILISSMTGGTELAKKINGNLAMIAEKYGLPMGLGSMRAAAEKKELADTYSVINNYKVPVKLANIGAPQLIKQDKPAMSREKIDYLMELIDAKFLILHFNFLQEMIQPEGDRNAKGVLREVKELAASYPVIAKETGAGFSLKDVNELIDVGVKAIDVGGLGGTTFAAIEYYRAEKQGEAEKAVAGKTYWNWGIPSPISLKLIGGRIPSIGSGGLRNGLDLARAISMGATLGGFARTLLSSADKSVEELEKTVNTIIRELKIAMFMTGSKDLNELKRADKFIHGPLKEWSDYYDGR